MRSAIISLLMVFISHSVELLAQEVDTEIEFWGQKFDIFFGHFAWSKSQVQLNTWQDLLKPSEDDLDSLFVSSYVPTLKQEIESAYESEIFKVSYFKTQRGYEVLEIKSENLRNGRCDKCPASVKELGKYVRPGQMFYGFTLLESGWKKSYFLFAKVGRTWKYIPAAYKEPIK